MGSFAYSAFVKSLDAPSVTEVIERRLRAQGYRSTDDAPGEDARWGMPSKLRAVQVAEPVRGWVGVLDSDCLNSLHLVAHVARDLATHSLAVAVNDSSSWNYLLWWRGEEIDQFDSAPALGSAAAQGSRELVEMGRQMLESLKPQMPADVRRAAERVESNKCDEADIQLYLQWLQQHFFAGMAGNFSQIQQRAEALSEEWARRFNPSEIQAAMDDATRKIMEEWPGVQIDAPTNPSEGAAPQEESSEGVARHAERLRPFMGEGVSEEQVIQLLAENRLFAEETLAEFLKLLGIPPFFAYLSYGYLEETTKEELAENEIRLVAHLKFKCDQPPVPRDCLCPG
jgi:hypothetical protein